MGLFVEFLRPLFSEGSVLLSQRPVLSSEDRAAAAEYLANEFAFHRLHAAGPALDFDAVTAVLAAEWLWTACWLLVSRNERAAEVERQLSAPAAAATPSQHLSADLSLRFLVGVYRRAHALAADDVLTRCLSVLLRQWPLSGVLSDVTEGPLTTLDFGGHAGLALLYAERLADHVKPAWMPADGSTRDHVELVFTERGLRMPL